MGSTPIGCANIMKKHLVPYRNLLQQQLLDKFRPFVMGRGHDCSNDYPCDCQAELENLVTYMEEQIDYVVRRVTDH